MQIAELIVMVLIQGGMMSALAVWLRGASQRATIDKKAEATSQIAMAKIASDMQKNTTEFLSKMFHAYQRQEQLIREQKSYYDERLLKTEARYNQSLALLESRYNAKIQALKNEIKILRESIRVEKTMKDELKERARKKILAQYDTINQLKSEILALESENERFKKGD